MNVLTSLTFALIIAYACVEVVRYFKFPRVVGLLLSTFIIAIPFVKSSVFSDASVEIVGVFSNLAIIFLLFLTGLEIDLFKLKGSWKDSLLIAFFAALVPFVFGFSLILMLGYSYLEAFIFGGCLSVTAEGTKMALLIELKQVKSRIGSIMLAAGIMDDFFEILFLSTVLVLAHRGNVFELQMFPIKLIVFAIIIFVLYKILPGILRGIEKRHSEISLFSYVIVFSLVLAMLSDFFGLGAIIGAFIAGVLVQKSMYFKIDERNEDKNMRLLTMGFIVPFFFIYIGLHFDYLILVQNPQLVFLVIFTAIAGKIIGTLLVKPFSNLSWKQLHLIGWAMNSRGVVELVVAEIARANNLISSELYSAIVLMAIVTTMMFPIVFRYLLKWDPDIMN